MPLTAANVIAVAMLAMILVAMAVWLLRRRGAPISQAVATATVPRAEPEADDNLPQRPMAQAVDAPKSDLPRGDLPGSDLPGSDAPRGDAPFADFLCESPESIANSDEELIRDLFRQAIPAVAEGDVRLVAVARIPGYKTKVALSHDGEGDCLAACGQDADRHLQQVADQLPEEQIDLIRWSDRVDELVENSLQPLSADQIVLCDSIQRALVLVDEACLLKWTAEQTDDVRLASRLCNWEIAVLTEEQLDRMIEAAIEDLSQMNGIGSELAQHLAEQGCLFRRDLARLQPQALASQGRLSISQASAIAELAADAGSP